MHQIEKSLTEEFLKLGATEQNVSATYQVYLELCEVRKLFDVEYHFNESLKRMYLTAKHSKSEKSRIYFPVATSENLSFNKMQDIIKIADDKSITLAIISPDSNCVFYQISDGLSTINQVATTTTNLTENHDKIINSKRSQIEQFLNLRAALPSFSEDTIDDFPSSSNVSRPWFTKDWK